ncbi:hypothetical protein EON76_05280 [bacterium]|nr:MAG: hypothetical protein EON76_05280 [bacterium]
MSVMSWLLPRQRKIEAEKKELKVELTQAIMKFERSRGEVESVANDVMELMHRRRKDDKK